MGGHRVPAPDVCSVQRAAPAARPAETSSLVMTRISAGVATAASGAADRAGTTALRPAWRGEVLSASRESGVRPQGVRTVR